MTLLNREVRTWIDVCAVDDLIVDRGACVFVDGAQIAVFRLSPADDLYAISNVDPFSGASVLSRGIVGSKGDIPKVASPIYKQTFDLGTGVCLDDASVTVPTFPIRAVGNRVEVGLV